MKFVCLNDKGWVSAVTGEPQSDKPTKGDVVTKTSEYASRGILYYRFEEYGDRGLNSNCFMPLNEPEKKEEMKEVEFTEIKKEIPVSAN